MRFARDLWKRSKLRFICVRGLFGVSSSLKKKKIIRSTRVRASNNAPINQFVICNYANLDGQAFNRSLFIIKSW